MNRILFAILITPVVFFVIGGLTLLWWKHLLWLVKPRKDDGVDETES